MSLRVRKETFRWWWVDASSRGENLEVPTHLVSEGAELSGVAARLDECTLLGLAMPCARGMGKQAASGTRMGTSACPRLAGRIENVS